MAEQVLVADLRVNITKFDADLRKATQSAEKASAGIAKALDRIDSSLKTLPAEVSKLNQSLQQTEQATTRAAQATERQTQTLGRLKGVLGSLGLLVTAQQMIQFAVSTVKAAESLSSIERQFKILTGSQKAAQTEMAFIRGETERLALSTLEGAKGYARLANAAAGTKLAGEGVRQVFMALNTVTRALALSNDEYGRILNQVTQIISKGRVQTEELITLSESGIPIFTMLAKSMNVSGEALADMLQKGKVSSQALILIVEEIQKRYAELARQASQTVPAQIQKGWNRLLLEVVDLTQGILNSGELLNAFKFESNILDIFPDREVITERVDFIIRQITAINLFFEGSREQALNSIKKMFSDIVASLQSFLTPIGTFFSKLPGSSWVAEQFQALVAGLTNAGKKIVEAQKDTDKLKDSFFGIFGSEGQSAIQRWNAFVSDALANVGKEMPSPIDSKKIAADASEANAELLRLQKQAQADLAKLQEEARQEKRHKDVATEEEAMRTIASMRRRLDDEAYREEERNRKQRIEAEKDAANAIRKFRLELEADIGAEQEKTHQDFLRILERTNKERIAFDQLPKTTKEFEKTIDNLKEDLQRSLATAISDAMRGDLDNIKDIANTITEIFSDTARTIASNFIAAFAIDPIVNQLKKVLNELRGVASEEAAKMTTGGKIATGVGGAIGGVGVGYSVSQMAGGGRTGGAIGGVAGGAITGATIGSMFDVPVIGALVGAVVGGIIGGLMGKDKEKTALHVQTTAGLPATQETAALSRSPFGVISMFENAEVSKAAASNATIAISEIDSAIAAYLNTQQREIVKTFLQAQTFESSKVRDEDVDDAIAKAIQLRFFHAISALQGEEVAKNIVGEIYTADKGSIGAIQARAMEALEILATIADFKTGDLSQTAQAIKAINDQFQLLKDRAQVLGLPTAEIEAEQQKQLAKITTDFNQGIGDAILGITDPVKLEFIQLERMQQERMQNAIDAGADLTAVEQLNQLEREELEKRHQGNLTDIVEVSQKEREAATANIMQAIFSITDPFQAALIGIQQQVAAFQAQADAGLIDPALVAQFQTVATDDAYRKENERREQELQAVEDFNQGISDSLATLGDDYAREMLEMDRMHEERLQKAVEMGADINAVAELNQKEREQAEAAHQDRLNQIQAEKQKQGEDALDNLMLKIYELEDPFKAVLLGIEIEAKQLQALVEEVGLDPRLVDRYLRGRREQAGNQRDEQLASEAQAVADFNYDINQSILQMTDSYQAELNEMNRIHQERLRSAMENGADINAVIRLNNLESEQLARQHADDMLQIQADLQQAQAQATANITQMIYDIEDPFMGVLFSIGQQADALRAQFEGLGMDTSPVDRWQALAIGQAIGAENDRQIQIIQAEDERIAREAEQRQREREQAAADRQRAAEERRRAAEQKKREAEQRKREAEQAAEQRRQEAERRRQNALRFNQALMEFTDPVGASMLKINEQVREFQEMTKEGLISKSAVEEFRRLSLATLEINQALEAIGGGGGSPIEQVGDAFEQFIKAGSPQSEAVNQMEALQEQFAGLVEAADMLGLSTADLRSSYIQQARVIREQAIDAINKEMDARKEQLKQIDDFLAEMRVSDVLPANLRLDEARKQFEEAAKGGDVEKAVSASQQYLGIAQEQFGTTQGFFSVRNEVERMLTNLREQETRNIESERDKLIRQEERELEQVQIGRSSVDYLKRISNDNSATSRGIDQLIAIAKGQADETAQTRQLLLRLAAKIKA